MRPYIAAIMITGLTVAPPAVCGQQCYQHAEQLQPSVLHERLLFGGALALHDNLMIVTPESDRLSSQAQQPMAWVFRGDGASWSEEAQLDPASGAELDLSSNNVAAGEDLAVIGVPRDDTLALNAGSVYVFRFNGGEDEWVEDAVLDPPSLAEWELFGQTVAVSGDTLFVGAPNNDDVGDDAGAVYVYEYVQGTWQLEQTIYGPAGADSSDFGQSVDHSSSGLFIGEQGNGTFGERAGAVHIYQLDGATWTFEQTLYSSDIGRYQRFGRILDADGDSVAVGARHVELEDVRVGAIHVFQRQPDSTWVEQAALTPPDVEQGDGFPRDPIVLRGDLLCTGSSFDNDFERDAGSAHIWQRTGDTWSYEAKLWPPVPDRLAYYGMCVAIDDEGRVLVGDPRLDGKEGTSLGAVRIYELSDVAGGDCNANGIPDACEPQTDCNGNGVADICDIANGFGDCGDDLVLDECAIADGAVDCDEDGIPDNCAIRNGLVNDCNGNEIPDPCDFANGLLEDCNDNGVADLCEVNDYQLESGGKSVAVHTTIDADELWMNRFVVQSSDGMVNSLSVYMQPHQNPNVPVTLLLYSDPNDDGDPHDGKLLTQATLNSYTVGAWNRVYIEPSYVGEPGEVFYVAGYATVGPVPSEKFYMTTSHVHGSSDLTASYLALGEPNGIDLKNLTGFIDFYELVPFLGLGQFYEYGPWLLRADATHFQGVPIDCMCASDVAGAMDGGADGVVDEMDLMALLDQWGACAAPCAPFCDGDVTGSNGLPDCSVDVHDLLATLSAWGNCE